MDIGETAGMRENPAYLQTRRSYGLSPLRNILNRTKVRQTLTPPDFGYLEVQSNRPLFSIPFFFMFLSVDCIFYILLIIACST